MPFLDASAVENDPDGITFLRAVIGGARPSGATRSWNWKAVATAPEDRCRRYERRDYLSRSRRGCPSILTERKRWFGCEHVLAGVWREAANELRPLESPAV
jgi:hypothetical protein